MRTTITPGPAYQKPSGKLYLAADQENLESGVNTLVELDTIPSGFTDGIEDDVNHKITPGHAGFYDVKGQVYFKDVVADTRYIVTIRVNGTDDKVTTTSQASMGEYLCVACAAHLYLSATDYLTLVAQSRAGVDTVDILGGEIYTFLSVQRVR